MLAGVLLLVLALSCAEYLRRRKYRAPKGLKLPPGPSRMPFVGSFFDLYKAFDPAVTKEWYQKYGDILSTNVFGIPVFFIFSDEIVQELFEKRGALYSDRYPFHMAWLLGWDYNVGLMQYGDWWRRHVRVLRQFFNSRAVLSFQPIELKARRELIQNLLKTPEIFSEHIQFSIARVIMDVIYAIDIKPENDYLIDMVHAAVAGGANALLPGAWLVDIFPQIGRIPDWIPGIPFKKLVRKYREPTEAIAVIPFNVVKDRKVTDHSFVSRSLERLSGLKDPLPDEEAVIKNTAGTAYAAGAGTSFSALIQAVVASVLYPDIQKKIHDELDDVLGDRLPTLADRLPLGVAHSVLEDDIYGDYFIPKGSIVVADSWSILRGKKYGPNPDDFNPERFLQPGILPPTEQFGFGRRKCTGRFFASNIMFLFIASVLKVFDIVPAKDENGNDIPVTDRFTSSGAILPEPFQCSFKLRSPRLRELILNDGD